MEDYDLVAICLDVSLAKAFCNSFYILSLRQDLEPLKRQTFGHIYEILSRSC